jgi:hypothetical protein
VLALALPLGLMMLLGNSIALTVTGLPIIVQDLDDTPASRSFIDAFPPIGHLSCRAVVGR